MEKPNLNYVESMSGGDKDFEANVIAVMSSELQQEIKAFDDAIVAKDLKLAAQSVNKIKHKVGLLGLEKGYKTTADFEASLKNGQLEGLKSFRTILESITNFVNTL